MQYYRTILRDERLRDHFQRPEGRVRYGTSCRDVSLRLPQALVALHAAAATRHLLQLGHKTVWHLAGPSDWKEAEERVEGWRSVLESAGAPIPGLLRGDWTPGSGYELGEELLHIRGLSAVFVANDQMAIGVLRAMHQAGQ